MCVIHPAEQRGGSLELALRSAKLVRAIARQVGLAICLCNHHVVVRLARD